MANKIVAVLKHAPLSDTLKQHGSFEVRRRSWADAAKACVDVYAEAVSMVNGRPGKRAEAVEGGLGK